MPRRQVSTTKPRRAARPALPREPEQKPIETRPEDPFDDFCGLLVALRKEKGLTQGALGSILYVSQKTIHRWEDGARPPPLLARGILVALDAYAPHYVSTASEALQIVYPVAHPLAPPETGLDGQPSAPPPNPAVVKAAFEGALFEASERLGASSARVRDAVLLVLERMTLLQLDAEAAARIAREKR